MRRTIVTTLCAAMLVLASGCGDTHESLMDDMFDEVESLTAVLKTIKDEASAKNAESKLRASVERMKVLRERANKMKKPDAEQEKALQAKFEERAKKVMNEFMSETMRVSSISPEVSKILSDMRAD